MLDEEKKAIESFKAYINAIDTFGTISPKCCNNLYEPVETVLNLIQKQEKEIDKMAEEFVNKTLMYSDMTKQEVREYFEKKVSE